MNINLGGTKGWDKIDPKVRDNWYVMDIAGQPDYLYNINSGEPFPFKDSSIDNYYCSMTLEHAAPEFIPH